MTIISTAAAARRGKDVANFVACVVVLYSLFLLLLIRQPSDEEAEELVDRKSFLNTSYAFATAITIESLHIVWGMSPGKRNVTYLVLCVKLLAFTTSLAVASGVSPVWIDFNGRVLVPGRYLQWSFTTPSLLFLIAQTCPIDELGGKWWLYKAMGVQSATIAVGFLASCRLGAHFLVNYSLFFVASMAFSYSMAAMLAMFTAAGKHKEHHSAASVPLVAISSLVIWVGFPVTWMIAAMNLISIPMEESEISSLDVSSKLVLGSALLQGTLRTMEERREAAMEAETILLQRTEQHKQRVFQTVSHELRTPLNGIVGLSEAILSGATGEISARCKKNVQAVVDCGNRLTDVIKNMLHAVEDPSLGVSMNVGKINVHSIANDVAEIIRPLLKTGVLLNLTIPENLTMEGDWEKAAEIMYKICENAAKVLTTRSLHALISRFSYPGREYW
jgi:bacteriorhodopsin